MYLGIDPGSEQTAYAYINDDYEVIEADKLDNNKFFDYLRNFPWENPEIAVESIQSYGMAVGKTIFETCYVIGRIIEICEQKNYIYRLYPRPEYARAVCGTMKANDTVVRRAIINRFGGDRKGEPLHLLKGNSDKRSAFAVAVYHLDKMKLSRAANF
jgi:Holliday junction resolvasome RuvABC endonuclease subunit